MNWPLLRNPKLTFRAEASDEGLTLETSPFEFLYGCQFTLLTQLINPNFHVLLLHRRAPQLKKLTTFSIYELKRVEVVCSKMFKLSPRRVEVTGISDA